MSALGDWDGTGFSTFTTPEDVVGDLIGAIGIDGVLSMLADACMDHVEGTEMGSPGEWERMAIHLRDFAARAKVLSSH